MRKRGGIVVGNRALLMAGLLTNSDSDIQYVMQNITGEEVCLEDISGLITSKNNSFVPIESDKAGKPTFCNMDSGYASALDAFTIKIRESKYFGELEWHLKNVEISPLVSSALFLDNTKVESFYNNFTKRDYADILHICLDLIPSKIYIHSDGKNIIYQCDNNEIIGMKYEIVNTMLQILPIVNISPVKVVRIADKYRLIDGHCRAVALKKAGYDYMPAIVLNDNPGIKYASNNGFAEHMLIRENPPIMEYFLNKNCSEEIPLCKKHVKINKVQIDTTSISV